MSLILAFDNIRSGVLRSALWLAAALLLHGCNITKQLKSSQQVLLNSNEVKVTDNSKKEIVKPLPSYIKQRPNKRFIGISRLKMRFFFYGSRDNSGRFSKYLRDKFGEPPVIIDTAFMESTTKSMKSFLRSKGHYYAEVDYKVKVSKRNRAKVTYIVTTNEYYRFGGYYMNVADRDLYDLIKAHEKDKLIRSGKRFDQEVLLKEQQRILDLLRNNGYYTFGKEFINFDIDTAAGNWRIDVYLNVKNKSDFETHKKHYIRDVYVNIDPNIDLGSMRNVDTVHTPYFDYIPNRYKLNPDALDRNMFLRPGTLFRQRSFNRTYTRLSDLNIFRMVNITPKQVEQNDSSFIDYYVRLAPTIKYDYTIEPQAILSDQNNTFTNQTANYGNYGLAAVLQFNNRNTFRNAELFRLSYRTSFEAQGRVNGSRWFNATEQSLTASITMPRLLWLPKLDRNLNFFSTKTTFTTSAIYELNTDFERQVLTAGMIYQMNKRLLTFYVTPLEISYSSTRIKSDLLQQQINSDIYLFSMFSNNLIVGSRFGFSYSNKPVAKSIHHIFLKWDVIELGGNSATLVNTLLGEPKNSKGYYEIFGINYAQFAKTAIDFRFNTVYDENNATVYRLFAGVGLPYGNSPNYLPFERRFWVGGANSLRAWLPRSLGPGSFKKAGQIDFSGDVKLEANAEFRFNMYDRWLEGAVFSDAGNVWIIRKDVERPNAEFAFNRFYKELAVDFGYGVRLNFDIILIRFDFAVPVLDPGYVDLKDRLVIRDFSGKWFFENVNVNFGIGYPF